MNEEKAWNINYAKPFCDALKAPKSTPKYSDKLEGNAIKHMALHTYGLTARTLKEIERVGLG